MAKKDVGKETARILGFGFGLIFDLIVIIGALIKECTGSKK